MINFSSKKVLPLVFVILSINILKAQVQQKEINEQSQAWVSINSTVRVYKNWGFIADAHVRRTNFAADPSFFFLRGGINYWVKDNFTLVAGYGRMWVAPSTEGWHHFAVENRVYEQAQIVQKTKHFVFLNRLRNEQRWQEKIAADTFTGNYKFTDRIRYLINVNAILFKNRYYPSLVVADELCVQFGKEVVYNTFDQNRMFFGLKQNISKPLSFDIGYMWVYQQLPKGYQYGSYHTFRLFFYYSPDFRKKKV